MAKVRKWKYAAIATSGNREYDPGTEIPMNVGEEHTFDTPEEALRVGMGDYPLLWNDYGHYVGTIKGVDIEIPDPEPAPHEQVWKIESNFGTSEWSRSSSYPQVYNRWEADAIVEHANKEARGVKEYRKARV